MTSSTYIAREKSHDSKRQTYQNRPWHHTASSLLLAGPTKMKKRVMTTSCIYNNQEDSDFDLGASRRLCCLLPRFEDSGNISLIVCAKGVSMPSSVPKHRSNFSWNSAWTLSVSICFDWASSLATLRHSGGRFLQCRANESPRAKKSPQ